MNYEPGVYPNLAREEYNAIPAARYSHLKHFEESPAHVHHQVMTGGDRTHALEFGNLVDISVLEPKRLDEEYAVPPSVPKVGKDAIAEWNAFEAAHPNMVGHSRAGTRWAIKKSDYDVAQAMRLAAWEHPGARALLDSTGSNQVAMVWNDPITGVTCKALLDRLAKVHGMWVAIDLKTFGGFATIREWEMEIARRQYHIQAAMYCGGLSALGYGEHEFLHIVMEKSPPHGVRVFQLSSQAISIGQTTLESYLRQYKACTERDEWPGYPIQPAAVALPNWAIPPDDLGGLDDE